MTGNSVAGYLAGRSQRMEMDAQKCAQSCRLFAMQARDVSARVASLERPAVQQRPSGARSLPAEFRDTEIVSS